MENTEFDLEWAKRGGVVKHVKPHSRYRAETFEYYKLVGHTENPKIIYFTLAGTGLSRLALMEDWHFDGYIEMATKSECEAAGVEYIEPPVELNTTLERIVELYRGAKNERD